MSNATEVAPECIVVPAPLSAGPLQPWAVIVHNDNVNTFEFVIRCLREIARLDLNLAIERTNEIHVRGASPVACSHREHAEMIGERLKGRGLTVTIERA